MAHVKKHAYVAVDILAVAEAMEARHPTRTVEVIVSVNGTNTTTTATTTDGMRRTKYPAEHGSPGSRPDDNWHIARNQHLRAKYPPVGQLYNGMVLSIDKHREFYLVENGSLRAR